MFGRLDKGAAILKVAAPTSFVVPPDPFDVPMCRNCDDLGVVFTMILPDGSKEDIRCAEC